MGGFTKRRPFKPRDKVLLIRISCVLKFISFHVKASTKKLEESANRVEEATKELDNNEISTVITELEERLYSILQDMQKGLHENITTNFEPLKSFMNLQKGSTNQDKTLQVLTAEEWQRYIHNVVIKELVTEGMTLVYACFLYENDLDFLPEKTRDWFKAVVKKDIEAEAYSNIIHAQMRLLASLNVLTIRNEGDGGVKFTYINQTVLNEIKPILEEPKGDVKNMVTSLKRAFKIE
ncbi:MULTISPECIES: hypothetical protein [unclassified Lysinibacillus]|uniref:hypothetical protein n=1 Tax=unclassified Lysinibacillus TaxID=2636778 RepID=UPI003828585B